MWNGRAVWASLLVFAVVQTNGFAQSTPELQVGDRVVVVQDSDLTLYSEVIASIDFGLTVRIEGVSRERVLVRHGRSGWLDRTCVLRPDEVIATYTKVIAKDPNDAKAYRLRAAAWKEQKKYAQAIDDINNALRISRPVPSLVQRGLIRQHQADYETALIDFDEAIRLAPTPMNYYRRGRCFYWKTDYWRAVADFDEAIRIDPQCAAAYYGRGEALRLDERYYSAINSFDTYLKLEPDDADGYFGRGSSRFRWNLLEPAVDDLTKAIRLNPKREMAYGERGRAWSDLRKYDAAIADILEARRLMPKDPDWYYCEAWIRCTAADAEYRNGAQAMELALKACELSNYKDAWALSVLGAAYAELGQFETAIEWAQRAGEMTTNPGLKQSCRQRVEQYREGKPVRY